MIEFSLIDKFLTSYQCRHRKNSTWYKLRNRTLLYKIIETSQIRFFSSKEGNNVAGINVKKDLDKYRQVVVPYRGTIIESTF